MEAVGSVLFLKSVVPLCSFLVREGGFERLRGPVAREPAADFL
jgi:hypothetical protein